MDPCEVPLFDFVCSTPFELSLKLLCKMASSRKQDQARCVGIKSVGRSWILRTIDLAENELQRVPAESATRMHGQWCGFVDHNDGFVFVNDPDVDIHFGFNRAGDQMHESFSGTNDFAS